MPKFYKTPIVNGPLVIGTIGTAKVGKSTISSLLQNKLRNKYGLITKEYEISFPLKSLHPQFHSMNKEDARPIWQRLGRFVREEFGQDHLLEALTYNMMSDFEQKGFDVAVIGDVRTKEEVEYIRSILGGKIVKVVCNKDAYPRRFDTGNDSNAQRLYKLYMETSQADKTESDAKETEGDFTFDNSMFLPISDLGHTVEYWIRNSEIITYLANRQPDLLDGRPRLRR